MPDLELKALGELAGRYADEALLTPVQGVHSAISGRVFGALGRVGLSAGSAVPRLMHDTISRSVYGTLRLGGIGVGKAISRGAPYPAARPAAPPSATRASAAARRQQSTG